MRCHARHFILVTGALFIFPGKDIRFSTKLLSDDSQESALSSSVGHVRFFKSKAGQKETGTVARFSLKI